MVFFCLQSQNYFIKDLGSGMGTFLKCDAFGSQGNAHGVEFSDNSILQIGASLYCLANVISREEYEKFAGSAQTTDFSFQDDLNEENRFSIGAKGGPREKFARKLNKKQSVLRLKFFGGKMTGKVHYFVPEWAAN
jgi:hypothetical protein